MKEGFNCVIPYGEWEGGDVMLWEIAMRVEVRRVEALFFRGNVILHNAQDITGSRNCVDLFIHQNVVTLDEQCKWGSGLLKSRLCFLTSKKHKQDYKQRGTTTWG